MRPSPLSGGEVPQIAETASPGGDVARSLHLELSGPADVKAAHTFFQPSGAETLLPPVPGLSGSETATTQLASKFTETAVATAAQLAGKLGEGAAMSAAQAAGAQAVSPLIQMIMRMPGHLGLMSSFFEALGQFFMGPDILLALDPTLLAQQAGSVLHTLTAAVGNNLMQMTNLPTNLAANHFGDFGNTSLWNTNSFKADLAAHGNGINVSGSGTSAYHRLDVSGSANPSKLQFEQSSDSYNTYSNVHDAVQPYPGASPPGYLLSDASGASAFRPTFSNLQNGVSTTTATPATSQVPVVTGSQIIDTQIDSTSSAYTNNHSLLEKPIEPAQAVNPESTAIGGTPNYTIQSGDNLWNIARNQLGDGSRWSEIYHLNETLLTNHPNMIHVGDQLSLPPDSNVAAGEYVVKPGDNLWDISKHRLGQGQQWPEVYHANEAVIGSNPDLIHPGQHLTLSSSSHGLTATQPTQLQQVAPHSATVSPSTQPADLASQPLRSVAPVQYHPMQMAASHPSITDATTHGYMPTENIPTNDAITEQPIFHQQMQQQHIPQQEITPEIPRELPQQQLPMMQKVIAPQQSFTPQNLSQSSISVSHSGVAQTTPGFAQSSQEHSPFLRPEVILQNSR